ncbi:MAG: dTDP-4-dehydrorhamnose reductase [Bacteroidales bacterium]|nr:dTDP-4-dehydrorhamnose reductase [Bacteroidales bacterium]
MAKIIVTGSKGQLGQCLLDAATRFPHHHLMGYDIDQLDISDTQAVFQTAKERRATAIINCAAYTAVDKAEQEQGQAWAINSEAVKGLAEVCDRLGILLIHISTDFVFDGTIFEPYTEKDIPNPLSEYGASKLSGERFALSCRRCIVVRTSWLYAPNGHNFMSSIVKLGNQKEEIRVVNDQIGSPTYGPHLADALLQMVTQVEVSRLPDELMGLYHYANNGSCSRYEFAQKMKELSGFGARIVPVVSSEYPTLAKRPAYSVLDTKKITACFGIVPPYWADAIRPYMLFTNHKS